MIWQPTKQQLEDAARAGGKEVIVWDEHGVHPWQPYLPTTQGKADLLDLMLATSIQWDEENGCIDAWHGWITSAPVVITNNDKHAALAQAVLEVAAQIGGKMKC